MSDKFTRLAKSLDDMIRRLSDSARPKRHYVSHQSSNLDSVLRGLESRDYGTSFARLPHERVPSPLPSEPSGRHGIVYATVDGPGVDYGARDIRALLDEANDIAVKEYGNNSSLVPALREAGVGWVNNWNSIGRADELHVVDPRAVHVRRVFELPADRSYTFRRPLDPPPPARAYGIEDYDQPITISRRRAD
jgi:hypothetical protein